MTDKLNNIITSLFNPVDISSIVFIRVMFGIILFLQVGSYLFTGYIDQIWLQPDFHFKYYGFYWVKVLPESLLYTVVASTSICALFIAVGFLYRISTILFFVGFTYLFLLEQAVYLNHYYLVILISFLLIFIPANRYFSLDAIIWPKIKRDWISTWCLWILIFQISAVYVFGGIAKLNMDWFQGWPLWIWLNESNTGFFNKEYMVYALSYGGLLFDLLIVPLMFYKRTRIFGFVLAVLFHITNKALFNIGIFPYFSIIMTTLYFSPDWPRKLIENLFTKGLVSEHETIKTWEHKSSNNLVLLFITVFIVIQVVIPLRHFIYPGNVSWTEEGHNFAWHMKLRDKSGRINFIIRDPKTGNTWDLDPEIYLTKRQRHKMATRPYLAMQFAHYIEKQFKIMGFENVEVRAKAKVSLNGRSKQYIIDPNIDLTMYNESLRPAKWILPLTKPLRPINKQKT